MKTAPRKCRKGAMDLVLEVAEPKRSLGQELEAREPHLLPPGRESKEPGKTEREKLLKTAC